MSTTSITNPFPNCDQTVTIPNSNATAAVHQPEPVCRHGKECEEECRCECWSGWCQRGRRRLGGRRRRNGRHRSWLLGIPDGLSFDSVINGLTLPPCSTRDFMSYLQHVEHAAENLQFYLWYRDYATRFSRAVVNVPGSVPGAQEQVGLVGFAPKWTDADQSKAEEWVAGLYAQAQARMRGRMSGTEYGDGDGDAESLPALMARRSIFAELDRLDQPAAMPDKLPGAGGAPLGIMANARSSTGGPVNPAEGDHDGDDGGGNDHHSTTGDSFADEKTADAPATFAAANPAPSLPAFNFERAEIGSQLPESPPSPLSPMSPLSAPDGYPPWIYPTATQPFRQETALIADLYIAPGASRQLNLTFRERDTLLYALSQTTHPTAFSRVARSVERALRHQSHPRFIQWTVSNGRSGHVSVVLLYVVSATLIVCGLLAGILPIFSGNARRAWSAMCLVFFVPGVVLAVAAWSGISVISGFRKTRQMYPWELFADEAPTTGAADEAAPAGAPANVGMYEDKPWIPSGGDRKLSSLPWLRRLFPPTRPIQDPVLQRVQLHFIVRVVSFSLVISGVLAAIFLAVPRRPMFDF